MTRVVHVTYKGAARAVTDLIGDQVDLSFATLGSVLLQIKSSKLRALAVASRQRSALLPGVPTIEETGVKGCTVDTWYGVLAPAGTPPEVLRTLTRELNAFNASAPMQDRLAGAGLEPGRLCGDALADETARGQCPYRQRLEPQGRMSLAMFRTHRRPVFHRVAALLALPLAQQAQGPAGQDDRAPSRPAVTSA